MSKLAQAGASSTTPGRRQRVKAVLDRLSSDAASCTATAPDSASLMSGRASPIATTAFARSERRAQHAEVAALETAADDRHEPRLEALDRSQGGLDVGRLRVVHEPHAADLGHQLHRMLETAERFDGRRHRRRRRAGEAPTVAAAITSSTRCGPSR